MPDLGLVGFLRRVGTAPVLQWRIFGSFPAVGVCWGGGRGARGGQLQRGRDRVHGVWVGSGPAQGGRGWQQPHLSSGLTLA